MILGEENKPPLEDLIEHYGVKGMKWGHRKAGDGSSGSAPPAKRKPTATDIRNARIERMALTGDVNRAAINLNRASASGSKAKTATATKAYEKALKEYNFSDSHANALRYTNGEKAVLIMLTGPLAAVPIAGMALQRKSIQSQQAKLKAKT